MNGERRMGEELGRLQATLDAFGAKPERWPEDRRAELQAFVSANSEARRLCAEAAALDRLLDSGHVNEEAAPGALMVRIMAEVQPADSGRDGGNLEQQVAKIVPIGLAAEHRKSVARNAHSDGSITATRSPMSTAGNWASMAMLAASLVLGILAGGTGQLNTALEQMGILSVQSSTTPGATAFLMPMLDGDDVVGDDLL